MAASFSNTASEMSAGQAPESSASLVSRLSLSWMTRLIWRRYRTALESPHPCDLADGFKSADLASSFRQSTPSTSPLLMRLLGYFKREILLQGLWAAIASVTVYVPAHLLYGILRYLEVPNATHSSTAWLLVAALLVSGLASSLAHAQCEWTGRKTAAKLKSILTSEIYAKALRCKGASGSPV
ncbi:ABC transporter, transmembrane domain, type 1 [Ophiocordyceps sinensis CO18]|uniref:ABC transporter, transmembrane domain, type 1 n=1 Tax=Ophiocordyceps sinensis (strain Co18 / CGMCC 3.14243) TaxID=911162 RepID=T5AFV2_OPHSC|nr:ABC transporter, transmembrane domain, type 1 [Ophiocordyceps sinensis CO18]